MCTRRWGLVGRHGSESLVCLRHEKFEACNTFLLMTVFLETQMTFPWVARCTGDGGRARCLLYMHASGKSLEPNVWQTDGGKAALELMALARMTLLQGGYAARRISAGEGESCAAHAVMAPCAMAWSMRIAMRTCARAAYGCSTCFTLNHVYGGQITLNSKTQ